jgi:Sigma-70, region 4
MAQEGEVLEGGWSKVDEGAERVASHTAAVDGSLAMALLEDPFEDDEDDDGLEDDQGRRRRRSRARARTISIRRLSKTELNLGRMMYPEEQYWRPQSRGDCAEMERPCPFVSCKYHLYIDVHPVRGSIKINFPDLEVWEMTDTCALDIADRGGITLEEVGEIMNLTRERVRQVETQGLSKLERLQEVDQLRDYVDD